MTAPASHGGPAGCPPRTIEAPHAPAAAAARATTTGRQLRQRYGDRWAIGYDPDLRIWSAERRPPDGRRQFIAGNTPAELAIKLAATEGTPPVSPAGLIAATGPRDGGQCHWLQALDDAIKYRQARATEPCAGCGSVAGKCEDHARDLDLIAEYHRTARHLIEGPPHRPGSARGTVAPEAVAGVRQPGLLAHAAAGSQ
jgi:hypothetical protein